MIDLGDRQKGATFDFKFPTVSPTTGAPAALSGGAIEIYKANDATQSTAGLTLTADFDSITGQNHVRVVTTDSFYTRRQDYSIVMSAGTVGGVSVVGYTVANFSIEKRTSPLVLWETTIGTVNSQTDIELDNGPAVNDDLNGCLVILKSAGVTNDKSYAIVSDFNTASFQMILDAAPAFTLQVGDIAVVLAERVVRPTVTGRTLDITDSGNAGIDWGNIENGSTGNPNTTTVAISSNAITAASIATDAVVAIGSPVFEAAGYMGNFQLNDSVTFGVTARGASVGTITWNLYQDDIETSIANGTLDQLESTDIYYDKLLLDDGIISELVDGSVYTIAFSATIDTVAVEAHSAFSIKPHPLLLTTGTPAARESYSTNTFAFAIQPLTNGTAQGIADGPPMTITLDANEPTTVNFYKDRLIKVELADGTIASEIITGYSNVRVATLNKPIPGLVAPATPKYSIHTSAAVPGADLLQFNSSNQVLADVKSLDGNASAAVLLAISAGTMAKGIAAVGGSHAQDSMEVTFDDITTDASWHDRFIGRTLIWRSAASALGYEAVRITDFTHGTPPAFNFSTASSIPQDGDPWIIV